MTSSPQEFKLLDDLTAPEFFASYLVGAAYDGPNVRLTFASTRVRHTTNTAPPVPVVNARIVMSVPSAKQMVEFLGKFLNAAELNAVQKPENQSIQ
jgi:hypothetical protein